MKSDFKNRLPYVPGWLKPNFVVTPIARSERSLGMGCPFFRAASEPKGNLLAGRIALYPSISNVIPPSEDIKAGLADAAPFAAFSEQGHTLRRNSGERDELIDYITNVRTVKFRLPGVGNLGVIGVDGVKFRFRNSSAHKP
jgi:hypothetical protein